MNALQNYSKNKSEISWKANCVVTRAEIIKNINEIIEAENGQEKEVIQALSIYCKANLDKGNTYQTSITFVFPILFSIFGFLSGYATQINNSTALWMIVQLIIVLCIGLWFIFHWQKEARYQDVFILNILENWECQDRKASVPKKKNSNRKKR